MKTNESVQLEMMVVTRFENLTGVIVVKADGSHEQLIIFGERYWEVDVRGTFVAVARNRQCFVWDVGQPLTDVVKETGLREPLFSYYMDQEIDGIYLEEGSVTVVTHDGDYAFNLPS